MARTAGSDGTRTEDAIRQAAIDLIAAHGFEAMSLRQLAERVGVQPGAIYRYYASKAALLASLQREHLNFLLEQWRRERPADPDPVCQLRAFVAFHVRYHTLRRREAFVSNMELRSLAPDDYRGIVALRRRYENVLTRILRTGIEAGLFSLPEPRVATFGILAMLTGVGAWYREDGRLDEAALVAIHTRMVLQCVGLPRQAAMPESEPALAGS